MGPGDDEKTHLTAKSSETLPNLIRNKEPLTIGEAIERLSCGFGTVLYCLGPYGFMIMCGAELAVMTIVSLILKCEWGLSTFWTSIVQVVGMLTGTIFGLFLSNLGDRFGRRRMLILATFGVIVMGVLSGLSRELWQILVCRALLGLTVAIGAGPAATYSAEIPTIKFRSLSLSSVGIGWGIGTALGSGLAYLTLGPYGWRGYLIMVALLCLPVLILLLMIRESPRYDIRVGNMENAKKTLKSLSRMNCSTELEDVEIVNDQNGEELQVTTFYQSYQVLKTTGHTADFWKLILLTVTGQFIHMGMLYVAPRFMNDQGSSHLDSTKIIQNHSCSFDDSVLFDLGIIGLADPISVSIALLLVDKIGRRNLLFVSTIIPLLAMIPFYFEISSSLTLVVLIVTRGSMAVVGWLNFVIGSEYFPTSVRSFTSSIVNVCTGLSGVASSFVVQYAYDESSTLATAVLHMALLATILAVYSIKREMMGQQLEQ